MGGHGELALELRLVQLCRFGRRWLGGLGWLVWLKQLNSGYVVVVVVTSAVNFTTAVNNDAANPIIVNAGKTLILVLDAFIIITFVIFFTINSTVPSVFLPFAPPFELCILDDWL